MTIEKNNKILVAMSGGVDSSVTALLSKEMGLTPTGVTMVLFDDNVREASSMNVREATCFQNKNVIDAKAICDKLQILVSVAINILNLALFLTKQIKKIFIILLQDIMQM